MVDKPFLKSMPASHQRAKSWPNRDPFEEWVFHQNYLASLSSREKNLLSQIRPAGNEFVFVNNHPIASIDPFGLTKWCGTCETYGGGLEIGIEAIECHLSTPCKNCKQEYIHVKALFAMVTFGLPVNSTKFRTCFDASDSNAFNGAARFDGANVTVGVGKTGGVIVFGDAESSEISNTSGGFDASISFGAGRSWVYHYDKDFPCN